MATVRPALDFGQWSEVQNAVQNGDYTGGMNITPIEVMEKYISIHHLKARWEKRTLIDREYWWQIKWGELLHILAKSEDHCNHIVNIFVLGAYIRWFQTLQWHHPAWDFASGCLRYDWRRYKNSRYLEVVELCVKCYIKPHFTNIFIIMAFYKHFRRQFRILGVNVTNTAENNWDFWA